MAAEKQFEKKVKDFLESYDCWVLKTWSNGTQRKGIPDLLVCCNGYFLGIELKAPKGTFSELQKWNIQKIRKANGVGIVLYPHQFEVFQEMIIKLCNQRTANGISELRNLQVYFDTK